MRPIDGDVLKIKFDFILTTIIRQSCEKSELEQQAMLESKDMIIYMIDEAPELSLGQIRDYLADKYS